MSEDPDKTTADARGAELRENIALTDARRTEEERAKAEQTAERAKKEAEQLERKEQQQLEKAERLHAVADAERQRSDPPAQPYVADVAAERPLTQRPEVLVGAAFVGSFLVARILKRIFD